MSEQPAPRNLMSIALPGSLVLIGAITTFLFMQHTRAPGAYTGAAPAKTAAPVVQRFNIPVTASQPSRGNPAALVTLVEWNDLRSHEGAQIEPIVDALMKEYPNQVRVVWRNFPEEKNADSLMAAEFAMEAHTQGAKFWQARALLMRHPEKLDLAILLKLAAELGLDESGVKRAIESHAHGPHLMNDGVFAGTFGVTKLPAFFVNGVRVEEPTLQSLRQAIESELSVAQALIDDGVSAQNVYAELTKDGLWRVGDDKKHVSVP